jgi:hypothetical protein
MFSDKNKIGDEVDLDAFRVKSAEERKKDNHNNEKQTGCLGKVERGFRMYLGHTVVDFVLGMGNWLVNKPNPAVQIFYCCVAGGGFVIYVNAAFGTYVPGPYLGGWHRYTASAVMVACYYTFYKACTVPPGVIRDKRRAKLLKAKYDFDGVMYVKGSECKTCKIEKPARSKHCRVCDHCVEKFDHHCIWINQCVGAKNYKWFLLFLFLHIVICFYGGVVGILIFMGERQKILS